MRNSYSAVQKQCKQISVLFATFPCFLTKFNESSIKIFNTFRSGYCSKNQNENSCCSSKALRKFERKVTESINKFSRAVLHCIECSRKNSLRADRGKHHLNLHVDLPVLIIILLRLCLHVQVVL